MLTRTLRAGTAGLVTLSLLLPPAALAQDLPADLAALAGAADLPRVDGTLQVCVLGDAAPCVLLDGQVTALPEQAADALAGANKRAERTARQLVRADSRALGRVEPAPEVAEPAPEAVEPVPEPAPEVAAEPQPETVETEPEAIAEPQPETVEPAPEPAPEVVAEPVAEPAPEPVDPQAIARAERRAARAAERQAARAAELEAAREEAGRDESGETVEATTDSGLTEETAEAEAGIQAEEQEAAAEVTAAATPGDAAEVETTVIDAGDVRTSDEEIARSSGDAEAQAESRRRGLSPVETIAILGIGALIVGALLDNGDEVVSTSDDRAVARRPDGSTYVIKDDDALLRQAGSRVETRRFDDGSTITTVSRRDGSRVQTIRDATGRVLRRTKVLPDGTEVRLFDDTEAFEPVDVTTLPREAAPEVDLSRGDLADVLRRDQSFDFGRGFSLGQVRNIRAVRELVPTIDLDTITFDSGSAAIRAREADKLIGLGNAMRDLIGISPGEVFLIEGHTDAVGSAASNLTLSDRRAESLALALSEYFDIPPENMVIQGYGESYLKVPTLAGERANRRVAVRRITPLLVARN